MSKPSESTVSGPEPGTGEAGSGPLGEGPEHEQLDR